LHSHDCGDDWNSRQRETFQRAGGEAYTALPKVFSFDPLRRYFRNRKPPLTLPFWKSGIASWACAPYVPNNDEPNEEIAMGFFSRDIKNMDDLFVHTLRDIYYAEKQILKALPEMIEKSSDSQLKQGFQSHLGETKNHVSRLEQVFRMHRQEPSGVDCPAIDGIIEEANDVAGEVDDKSVMDAALIAAAQAIEHYEMTRYGSLVAWAKQLGRNDCAALLQQNLDEEKAADKKLTAIAESKVNRLAA
jgi:ferritin-like metal-binding protein YciE